MGRWMQESPNRSRDGPARFPTPVLAAAFLAPAILVLLFTGILGAGRTSGFGEDFDLIHVAGRFWLHGESPYDPARFAALEPQHRVFPYPPTFAPFCMLVALLPIGAARWAMLAVNLIALAALATITARMATHPREPAPASRMAITPWLLAAYVVWNPFTSRTVWIGQTTLVAAACLTAGWRLARAGRGGAAALLLGFVTFKPQVLLLPGLWLLLERRWKTLLLAALVALALAAWPLSLGGPAAVVRDWLHSVSLYQTQKDDVAGAMQVLGLPSFLAAAGFRLPLAAALALALFFAGFLWLSRARVPDDDVLGLLLVAQLGLLWGHHTELVLLAPAVAALWLHAAHRPLRLLVSGGLLLTLLIPWRTVQKLGIPLLAHWCTPTLLVLLLWMLWLGWSTDRREPAPG